MYQIGVYSYSLTEYKLTAWLRTVIHDISSGASADNAMTLFEGQSRFDWVSNGTARCYMFTADDHGEGEELEITVNVHEGTV